MWMENARRGRRGQKRTSSSSAKCAVIVATLWPRPDDLAVDVFGVVGVNVARASAAVGDFRDAGPGDDSNDVLVLLMAINI